MVQGLDKFNEHFSQLNDKYVLIGGTACTILMEEFGEEFRSTKDLDIVLIIESGDVEFARKMWEFIKLGEYENQEKNSGKHCVYRFSKPKKNGFPYMLEFFSKKPELISSLSESHLTPIPFDAEESSLSAILIDNDYYELILSSRIVVQEFPTVTPECLIILKSKAYLDLKNRKLEGETELTNKISKHRKDVLKLSQLITSGSHFQLPEKLKRDMRVAINEICNQDIDLKAINIKNSSITEIKSRLVKLFKIE